MPVCSMSTFKACDTGYCEQGTASFPPVSVKSRSCDDTATLCSLLQFGANIWHNDAQSANLSKLPRGKQSTFVLRRLQNHRGSSHPHALSSSCLGSHINGNLKRHDCITTVVIKAYFQWVLMQPSGFELELPFESGQYQDDSSTTLSSMPYSLATSHFTVQR